MRATRTTLHGPRDARPHSKKNTWKTTWKATWKTTSCGPMVVFPNYTQRRNNYLDFRELRKLPPPYRATSRHLGVFLRPRPKLRMSGRVRCSDQPPSTPRPRDGQLPLVAPALPLTTSIHRLPPKALQGLRHSPVGVLVFDHSEAMVVYRSQGKQRAHDTGGHGSPDPVDPNGLDAYLCISVRTWERFLSHSARCNDSLQWQRLCALRAVVGHPVVCGDARAVFRPRVLCQLAGYRGPGRAFLISR